MAYRPTAKTEARKQAQLELLLNSALLILSEHGFGALTMQALAAKAGLGTGTVYRYFDNKAHLCTEVFRIATEKEIDHVGKLAFPASPLPHAQCFSNIVVSFAHRAIAGRKLSYALIAEPVDPQVEVERLKYRMAYANILESLIDAGIEHGAFTPQNSRLTATAIVGILAEALLTPLGQEITSSGEYTHKQFVADLEQLCLRAVGAIAPTPTKARQQRVQHALSDG
jgi:AcrR family transcriptional regulator